MTCIEFLPVIVTEQPADEDHAPLLADAAAVRLVRAGDVAEGDLIVASVEQGAALPRTDYFNDQYEAHPAEYDATCGCGVCGLIDADTAVVLAQGDPWETCDPWPADDLVLIVPAAQAV